MTRPSLTLALVMGSVLPASAADISKEHAEFFTTKVKAILEKNCFSCHSHAAKKSKGDLVLDSRASLLKGGESGAAAVPGKPDESLFIQAIRYSDDASHMPPKGKLASADIAVLEQWVKLGLPWPGSQIVKTPARPRGVITDEDRKWWAFQPLKVVEPPAVADKAWSGGVDRFLRKRLEVEGLTPAPDADPVALLRRIRYDLTGLPPTPAEVDTFLAECRDGVSQSAVERLVDRLLATPHYGERWARHWLDLVRYSESDGFRIDEYRPDGWRYRDYVIESLNKDKPYDRFVQEQIAGDELFPGDPEALTGTSYLRLGIYEYNNRDVRTQWSDMLNELTDVTGDVFLGLGMQCARCHDHKFDPILQKDYFRLQSFFAAIQPRDDRPVATALQIHDYETKLRPWLEKTADLRARLEAIEAPERDKAAREAIEKFPDDIQAILHKPEAKRDPLERQLGALAYRQVTYEYGRLDRRYKGAVKEELLRLRRELAAFDALKPAPLPVTLTMSDTGTTAPPTFIPKRTNTPIEPGWLSVLDERTVAISGSPKGTPTTGRRAALASWLTRADNPLTARVMVNRVWQHHFGRGLAPISSDFGRLGEPPSHGDLLDWLTDKFVREGWSLKKLHREILTSAAYRQSAFHPDPSVGVRKDPENRLLWRGNIRRLDAEQIRDSLLAITGKLDPAVGGPSVDANQSRRSVYLRAHRNTRDPLLEVFDVPEGIQTNPQRNVTTTPVQALLLINGPYLIQQARLLADRLRSTCGGDEAKMIDGAYRLVLGRPATEAQQAAAAAFLAAQTARIRPGADAGAALRQAKLPYREGRGVIVGAVGPRPALSVPDDPKMPAGDFTVESFIVLKSLYDDASVRPIAARHGGDKEKPGWAFGVTSKKSAYKPQTLVLQLWGADAAGKPDYQPLFSDLHIDLDKPYFVAVSVKPADGSVTFFAKDLSNDDEPMQSAKLATKIRKLGAALGPMQIGGGGPKSTRAWDGLLDDVRLSGAALTGDQLLLNADGVTEKTVGYWQFEPMPGVLADSSPNKMHIRMPGSAPVKTPSPEPAPQAGDARREAFLDLCHVLLNSNGFLYLD